MLISSGSITLSIRMGHSSRKGLNTICCIINGFGIYGSGTGIISDEIIKNRNQTIQDLSGDFENSGL